MVSLLEIFWNFLQVLEHDGRFLDHGFHGRVWVEDFVPILKHDTHPSTPEVMWPGVNIEEEQHLDAYNIRMGKMEWSELF